MRSVELLLDEETDAMVRAEWAVLLDAGLPSQGRHPGASNAPHITLAAGEDLGLDEVDWTDLPLPVRWSGFVVFGAPPKGLVLARLVTTGRALITLHERVHERSTGTDALSSPGRWTPHVTLASRLTPAQLADALAVLAAPPVLAAPAVLNGPVSDTDSHAPRAVRARLWDGPTKTITILGPSE